MGGSSGAYALGLLFSHYNLSLDQGIRAAEAL